MMEILIAILGVLISVSVGALYYSMRMTCAMRKENRQLADRVDELEQVERGAEELIDIYEGFMENLKQEPTKLFLYLEEAVEDFSLLERYIDASLKCMVADDLIAEMEIGKDNFHELEKWLEEEKRRKTALPGQ